MNLENWTILIRSEGFWGGVLASILAAIIVSTLALLFRNSFALAKKRREEGKKIDLLLEESLSFSSPLAPFSFGIVQARALRQFLIAVFIAYVGDILGILWPFNIVVYILSLFFIGQALGWFYRLEKRGLEMLAEFRP